jgi:SdrD B-like domain/SprB repeat/CUB domain
MKNLIQSPGFLRQALLPLFGGLIIWLLAVQEVQAQTYTLGTAPATNGATITTCSGSFFDSGGLAGNYGNNQDITVTFTSPSGTPMILSFNSYSNFSAVGDQFRVYNGPNTSSPEFTGSPLITGSPFIYIATGGSITIRFVSNASGVAAGWDASVFCATESTITACSGSFTDPGGAGNYVASTAALTHICSNNGGQARVAFSSFATELNFDYLYVYDGATTASSQVAGSPFSGTTSPGTITGTGTCLTFLFVSDISGVAAGWNSTISCVPACAISSVMATPACSGGTYNVTGSVTFANPPTSGTLTVSDGAATQVFNAPFTSPQAYTLTGLTPGSGGHTVTATFSATSTCTNTATYTAPTSCMGADYVLGGTGATVNTCSGIFADGGDISANYANNVDQTVTFCSTTGSGDQITATFLNFATEAGNDLLYIYDGPNTSSPQVSGSPFSGSGSAASPGIVTASGTCLTFRFVSNASVASFGWEAKLSCSGGTAPVPAPPTWTGYSGTACTPNTKIEGTVFEDFDDDGVKDAAEPFMKDVVVTLYNDAGVVGAPTTTNASGLYSFTGLTAAAVYRVEFTVPANFKAGAHGTGSGTAVQFARAGTCSVNLGLLDKGHYCGLANPKWTTPCYNNGDPMHVSNATATGVARFDYTASGNSPTPSYENWVQFGTIGTVWGTAYRRDDATLYMASVLRRHTGLGPSGIGAIYKRADAGTNTSATVFYDFGAVAGTVATNAVRFPGTGNAFGQTGPCGLCDNLDPTTFGQVGKTGLGDIDLSADEKTMYVTNLFDRKVYTLNMNAPTAGSAVALPNQPWLAASACNNGTARPWALKYRQGKLYVGVICDAGTSSCSKTGACNDLTATVYVYDGAAWTTVLTYPLNYYRKAYALGSNYWVKWLDNWSDFTANYANVTDVHFAQPIMVDIEFDDDGSMIMGFGDRTAMQTGYQAPPPPGPLSSTAERTFAHGDMLRAAFNPGTGAFTLENNGVAGSRTTTNPASNVGPGGRAFYWGDHWYGAPNDAGIGALAILPGSGEVLHPVADPIDPYASGVVWSSNFNGSPKRKLEVYQGSPTGNAPNFAKNGGLGDIELHCAAPPLEIGNYVWWDHNLNGRMDPSEPGISNVNLTLYLDPDGNTQGNNASNGDEIAVATTKTDNFGRYIFSFVGAVNGLQPQMWVSPHNKVLPNRKYQVRINNFASDAGLTAFATGAGSPTFIMSATQNQGGTGGERDNNSYNNPGNGAAAVSTGGTGDNDHNFDFAFGPAGACSITAVPRGNTPCVGETLNLNANATGGTPPLTYSWAGPNGFTSTAASPSIANVTTAASGTYTVTIRDANSCEASFTVLVQVNGISVTAATTPTACGGSTGSITLTPTGGFTPYGFDWANNALDGTQNPTGLAAGNYPVTVTDANGCYAITTANITNTGGPTVNAVPTNPTCGNNNGSIALTVTGTGPFTYDWNVNALDGTEDPMGLGAGVYSVTVTAGTCIGVAEVTLTNTAGPTIASPVFVNTTCGANNGSINLTVSGGLAPYTYDWNVNALDGTEDPAGLSAGTYTVTVSDANLCTAMTMVVIAPSTGYTASTMRVNELCGRANGSIDLTVNGGMAPYSFDWNNVPGANNTEDLTGLAAGTYTVTITDANNCTATATAMLTNTAGITGLITTPTNATSCIANNGAIDLQVQGGTTPYAYDWSNDGHPPPDFDTEDLTGLASGTYTVTVRDANGCEMITSVVVGLNSGATLAIAVTDPVNCTQTGSLNLTITGGISPYTIDWSNVPGTNNPEDQTGLAGGAYRVTVTEANGCTTEASASVRDIREPALTVNLTQPACAATDGAIDLEVVGGDGVGPYTYNWSNLAPASDPQDQMNLGAGNYTVTVTDELQCTTVLTVNLSNSLAPELAISPINGTCATNNASIDLTITGGAPNYTIDWDNVAGTSDPEDQTGLGAGSYAVTVTDMNGCTAVGNVNLTVAASAMVNCAATDATGTADNGSISLDAAEVGPFTFDWSNNALDGIQNPTGLAPGTYTVTITDANNCMASCNAVVARMSNCNITITATVLSSCISSTFSATLSVDWTNAPTTGNLEYSLDGGPFQTITRTNFSANATGQTIVISGLTCNAVKMIELRFAGQTVCYEQLQFLFPPTDPAGYIYCVETGNVITGGTISVTPPAGGSYNIIENGTTGRYSWVATGSPVVAGIYTMTYTPPAGFTNTGTAGVRTGDTDDVLNPIFGSEDNPGNADPLLLGSDVNGAGTALNNFTAASNPFFFRFNLAQSSPFVDLNNLPVAGCCIPPALTVVTNGSVCAGGNIDLATLVTNAGGGTLSYYTSVANANAGTNALVSSTVTPASATNYYVRSQTSANCYTVKEITVLIKASVCGTITVTGPN